MCAYLPTHPFWRTNNPKAPYEYLYANGVWCVLLEEITIYIYIYIYISSTALWWWLLSHQILTPLLMTFFSSSACKSKRGGASFQSPTLSQVHTVPFDSIIQAYFRFALIKLQVTKDSVETVVLLFLSLFLSPISVFLAYLTFWHRSFTFKF